MKFNFWEIFAFQTALSALNALVSSSGLSDQQKLDVSNAVLAIQKVQTDFAA